MKLVYSLYENNLTLFLSFLIELGYTYYINTYMIKCLCYKRLIKMLSFYATSAYFKYLCYKCLLNIKV